MTDKPKTEGTQKPNKKTAKPFPTPEQSLLIAAGRVDELQRWCPTARGLMKARDGKWLLLADVEAMLDDA